MGENVLKIAEEDLDIVVSSFADICCSKIMLQSPTWNHMHLQIARCKASLANYHKNIYPCTTQNLQAVSADRVNSEKIDPNSPIPQITVAERIIFKNEPAIYLLWSLLNTDFADIDRYEIFAQSSTSRVFNSSAKFTRLATVRHLDGENMGMGATLAPVEPCYCYHICLRAIFSNGVYTTLSNIVIV